MGRNGRYLLIIAALLLGALLVVPGWHAAGVRAAEFPDPLFDAQVMIPGPLQLEVALDPPVAVPGAEVSLSVTLTNLAQVTYSPTVRLVLPSTLSLRGTVLPAGATFNVQSNVLNWQPIMLANGGAHSFTLPLVANTAVVNVPEQAVTAELQYDEVTLTAEAAVWVGLSPVVDNVLAPPQAAVGQPVQLTGEVIGSGPIKQTWDLGDGRLLPVTDPVVVFPAPGVYTVQLTAANPLSADVGTRTITIVPHPAAQFGLPDATIAPEMPVAFVNQSGGQPPLTYRWDFGDGTTSTDAQPTHAYANPGVYQVVLTVANAYGESQAYLPVTVGSGPMATFDLPASARTGLPLTGQAFGDESVTRFRWDMGDGRTYEGAFVNHIYMQTGDFYVRLVAENAFGGSEFGQWVRVEPGTMQTFLPLVVRGGDGQVTAVDLGRPGLGELDLPPVDLDEPFVMPPIDLPPGLTAAEQLNIYINEARAQFDLPALNLVPTLNVAAQQHTNDMARFGYTAHSGYDGSFPAERLLWAGYGGGYAGEATAWGFEYAYQAVEFWVNSPAHRRIILNEAATDVGVGYTVNFNAPNVWYWTAEFGNGFASAATPQMRLDSPPSGLEAFLTDVLSYEWNWPLTLQPDQQFVLVVDGQDVAVVSQPLLDTRYRLETAVADFIDVPGSYEWLLRLESDGQPVAESERRMIIFGIDPNLPTPTPTPVVVPSATPSPTPTMTPTPTQPAATPLPPVPTVPPVITATPNP